MGGSVLCMCEAVRGKVLDSISEAMVTALELGSPSPPVCQSDFTLYFHAAIKYKRFSQRTDAVLFYTPTLLRVRDRL